jgi:hypothetical protein
MTGLFSSELPWCRSFIASRLSDDARMTAMQSAGKRILRGQGGLEATLQLAVWPNVTADYAGACHRAALCADPVGSDPSCAPRALSRPQTGLSGLDQDFRVMVTGHRVEQDARYRRSMIDPVVALWVPVRIDNLDLPNVGFFLHFL